MNYEIKPYVGAGSLYFGMPSDEVRKILHTNVKAIDKGSSGIPTDFFRKLGILVYYRRPGICEAIEFGGPASPTLMGRHLLGQKFCEIESWIRGLDPDVVMDDAGLKTIKFGCSLYAPSARKQPDLPVEGVLVFEKGYYERYTD